MHTLGMGGSSVSKVLAFRPAGRPTGRLIGQGLGLPFGSCAFHTRTKRAWEIAIRWGGTEFPDKDARGVINSAGAIRTSSSKIASFRRLAEADVPIPRFTTQSGTAREWEVEVLGRTSEGFQGRGIHAYQPGERLGNHELYTEFIPNEREYRLHVIGGVVVSVQRKYLEHPHLRRSNHIKNHGNGYAFKTPERDLNTSRKDAAIAAVRALGLDFGAVDLIVDAQGKEYVLEVNTAPALSPMRVQVYVENLRPLLAARQTGVC